jgi:hypothetical protein
MMSDDQRAQFEDHVNRGIIVVPKQFKIGGSASPSDANAFQVPKSAVDAYNLGITDPYNVNAMPEDARRQFDEHLKNGVISLPSPSTKLEPTYMSTVGKIKEKFTGEGHLNNPMLNGAPTKDLPDYSTMPEMNDVTSRASWLATIGSQTDGPKEIAESITHNFPSVTARQDDHGNYVLQSQDGKQYLITPGATTNDILRALTVGGVFAGTGGQSTPAGRMVATGLTGGGLEAGTELARTGSIDAGEVAKATVLNALIPPAVEGTGAALKAGYRAIRGPAAEAVGTAAREAPAVPTGKLDEAAFKDLVEKAYAGDEAAKQQLIAALSPSQDVRQAAEDLNVYQHMTPAQVSSNPTGRAVLQGLQKGSAAGREGENEALKGISSGVDDLITKLGGTSDLGSVSNEVKTGLESTQKQLDSKVNSIYAALDEGTPKLTKAPIDGTLDFIGDRLDSFGGEVKALSPMERRILDLLSPKEATKQNVKDLAKQSFDLPERMTAKEYREYLAGSAKGETDLQPTYALVDNVRKEIGAALYKKQGEFANQDSGLLSKLYGTLTEDQGNALRAIDESKLGAARGEGYKPLIDLWAEGKATVAARKDVEDKLSALFGDKVDGSLLPKLSGATQALAKGDETKLINFINAIPNEQRERVVASGLSQAFMKNGSMDFKGFTNWYEAVQANKPAMNALMMNLPDYAKDSLQSLYKISKSPSKKFMSFYKAVAT